MRAQPVQITRSYPCIESNNASTGVSLVLSTRTHRHWAVGTSLCVCLNSKSLKELVPGDLPLQETTMLDGLTESELEESAFELAQFWDESLPSSPEKERDGLGLFSADCEDQQHTSEVLTSANPWIPGNPPCHLQLEDIRLALLGSACDSLNAPYSSRFENCLDQYAPQESPISPIGFDFDEFSHFALSRPGTSPGQDLDDIQRLEEVALNESVVRKTHSRKWCRSIGTFSAKQHMARKHSSPRRTNTVLRRFDHHLLRHRAGGVSTPKFDTSCILIPISHKSQEFQATHQTKTVRGVTTPEYQHNSRVKCTLADEDRKEQLERQAQDKASQRQKHRECFKAVGALDLALCPSAYDKTNPKKKSVTLYSRNSQLDECAWVPIRVLVLPQFDGKAVIGAICWRGEGRFTIAQLDRVRPSRGLAKLILHGEPIVSVGKGIFSLCKPLSRIQNCLVC